MGKPPYVHAHYRYTFNTNIRFGSEGNDVYALQIVLERQGLSISEENANIFGESTASAVVGFQERYKSEILTPNRLLYGTGFVGPSTRAKLNKLYGCSNVVRPIIPPVIPPVIPPSIPFIAVFSPNGGETWTYGNKYVVNFTRNFGNTAPIYVEMIGVTNGFSLPLTNDIFSEGSVTVIAGVPYNGNVNDPPMGQYYVQVCSTKGSICGRSGIINLQSTTNLPAGCTSTIGYSSTTGERCDGTNTNRPPVINGVDAPTILNINQSGTWTVRASDPENGQLSYSVKWGDEPIIAYNATTPSAIQPLSFVQTATFTHSYASSGVYAAVFYVKDNDGQVAQSSVTVQVGNTTTQPSITVTSPNGGETLTRGTVEIFSWKLSGAFPAGYVQKLRLLKTTSNLSQTVYPLYTFPADSTQTSYVWTVDKSSDGSVIPDGSDYKIQVVVVASNALGATTVALDESDSSLSIVSSDQKRSFETIEKRENSGHNDRKNYVIKEVSEWENLWNIVHGTVMPKPVLPSINFDNEMVIAVFQGMHSTGGYGIEIVEILEKGNSLEIQIKENIPSSGSIVSQVLTQPFHIIKTKRIDKGVVFKY